MRIYTTAKLSENISRTPEGYLLCKGAALARTGTMAYLPGEVPPELVKGFSGDQVLITRDAAEVFRPATLASFEGKPFTLDHPDEDVSPDNWSELAHGFAFNVRRGDGRQQDLMLADILITEANAIDAVRHDGMRELSCGYDCDFEVIRPGVGRQINIMGNHVALVDHGRAGARCKIKDQRETPMTPKKTNKRGWADKLRRLLKDAEAEEASAPQDEDTPPPQDEDNPVATTDDDVAASLEEIKLMLRTLVEALKPQGTDEDPQAQDEDPDQSAQDEDDPQADEDPDQSAQDEDDPQADEDPPVKSADRKPGRMADAATVRSAKRMGLSGCRVGDNADVVRRTALGMACRNPNTRRIVDSVLGGKAIANATVAEVRAAFAAVGVLAGAGNNRRTVDSLSSPGAGGKKGTITPAEINKLNAAYYGKGGK